MTSLNLFYSLKYENLTNNGFTHYEVSAPWKKNAIIITLTAAGIFLGYLVISIYRGLSQKGYQDSKKHMLNVGILEGPSKERQQFSIQKLPKGSQLSPKKENHLEKHQTIQIKNESMDSLLNVYLSSQEKEKFLKSLENIPQGSKHLDLRGKGWLEIMDLHIYFQILKSTFPQLNEEGALRCGIKRIKEGILANHSREFIAHPLYVLENHWTLVICDRKKRTVEYYDPMMNYGNHAEIVSELTDLTKTLTDIDSKPGQSPYTFVCKIKKRLQQDGYECGPWTLYFLEKRLKNPNIDFNLIPIEQARTMMADYRIKLSALLVDIQRPKKTIV